MKQSFYVLCLIISMALTFSGCKTKNPEYKDYYIVNNDTIAEIFLPEGSEGGILILWEEGVNMAEDQIREICNKLMSSKNCIRESSYDVVPEIYPNLYIYSRNKGYTDESMYIEKGRPNKFLYKFNAYKPDRICDNIYGYIETYKEITYNSFAKFQEGQRFKINGKYVEVVKSSQLYISFYSTERLVVFETALIRKFIKKYARGCTLYDPEEERSFYVDPAKRDNFYFFDTLDTDFKCTSYGNYISIIGDNIIDYTHKTHSPTFAFENILEEEKEVEDYFEFIEDEY